MSAAFSRHIQAEIPVEDQIANLRVLVVAIGNKVLEEQEGRRRLTQDVQQLRAQVLQAQSMIRTAGRR
jgi:hypothetical protein